MKKSALFLFLVVFVFILVSCSSKNNNDQDDPIYAIYELAVSNANYSGTYEEWLESVKGPKGENGDDGRDISLQVSDGFIQWQYNGDTSWTNLIDLISLTGVNGKEVVFQVSDGYIQWQYADTMAWTNLISLEQITGTNGKEVIFQVSDKYIQWQYIGENSWKNLIELELISGANGIDGIDGREIILQVNGDMLQWKYDGDQSWNDLIIYNNIYDSYYLSDNEINYILQNYSKDIEDLFPSIDLSSLSDSPYDNDCQTTEYEICHNSDNYPMIFGEGYEKFVDKEKSTDLLIYAMRSISDLMGTYDSEPIVPNEYLSGSDIFANVAGRNNTSILFEGKLDGSVPVSIPIDLQFEYQLLIYKSIEDNKIYVEGNIIFGSGFFFWDLEILNTSFLSTYSMNMQLDNFIYTTDVIGPKEWVTIIQPSVNGVEIYSTNQESLEYFTTRDNYLEIVYSSNWFIESPEYSYELYESHNFIYRSNNVIGSLTYEIPFSSIIGWTTVEFTNDSKIADNDLSFRIKNNEITLIEDLASESQVELESVWVLANDYISYFNNLGEIDSVNASNTIILRTDSKSNMISFLGSELTYNQTVNFDEHLIVKDEVKNYMFMDYNNLSMNFEHIFQKFNLRD
jgi:hypothetical protein